MSRNQNAILLIGLIVFAGMIGCNTSRKNPVAAYEASVSQPKDSILKREITALVDTLNAHIRVDSIFPIPFPYPYINQSDSISYWDVDGEPGRINFISKVRENIYWPTFFIKNDQLIHVRYRE